MDTTAAKCDDVFMLNMIKDNLVGYAPPDTPFNPAGDWRQTYDVLTLAAGIGTKAGMVEIERKNSSNNTFILTIHYQLEMAGKCTYDLAAEITCTRDKPSRTIEWRFTSVSLDPMGKDVKYTRIAKTGKITGDTMRIEGAGKTRKVKIGDPHLFSWALFDGVQRAGEDFEGLTAFTFIDDFDQVKPGHKLVFDSRQMVAFAGKAAASPAVAEMRCYIQTGQGILPAAYWVDRNNRCLFFVSGIEAYILRS
jgi:hypothetical protein